MRWAASHDDRSCSYADPQYNEEGREDRSPCKLNILERYPIKRKHPTERDLVKLTEISIIPEASLYLNFLVMLIRRRWPQFLCLLMFFAIEFQACSSFHFQTRLKSIGAFRTRPNSVICLKLRTDANGDDRDDNPQDRKKSQRSNRSNDPNDSDEEDDFELEEEIEKRMRERFQANGSPTGKKIKNKPKTIIKDLNKWEVVNRAVLAGVFVAGIGSGITIDSAINTNPRDLASRDAIGA